MFESIGSKHGVCCTSFQSFDKFGAHQDKCESSKNWIFRRFPNPNTIFLHDYQLNLCMLVPKGAYDNKTAFGNFSM